MGNIIWIIVKAIFLLWVAIYGFLFYTGRLKCNDEKERIRKERVKKYKWIIIPSIIVLFIGGISMLLGAIKEVMR